MLVYLCLVWVLTIFWFLILFIRYNADRRKWTRFLWILLNLLFFIAEGNRKISILKRSQNKNVWSSSIKRYWDSTHFIIVRQTCTCAWIYWMSKLKNLSINEKNRRVNKLWMEMSFSFNFLCCWSRLYIEVIQWIWD